jgi:hypothetical protein
MTPTDRLSLIAIRNSRRLAGFTPVDMTTVAIILADSNSGSGTATATATATAMSAPRPVNSVALGKDIVATIPAGQLAVGVDVEELVREVLSVTRRLAAKGLTMVVITREFGFTREVANSIVFMEAGHMAGQGAPAELLGNPRHKRTQASMSKVL